MAFLLAFKLFLFNLNLELSFTLFDFSLNLRKVLVILMGFDLFT
jgi:hypothetical protein